MGSKSAMAGWIFFAGVVMVLIGALNVLQGLIAVFEDDYYVPTQAGYLVVDLSTWGWALLFWGLALGLVGLALIGGQGWARWVSIVLVGLNVIAQLGFVGSADYPLWALTVLALNVIVLYALCARWSDAQDAVTQY